MVISEYRMMAEKLFGYHNNNILKLSVYREMVFTVVGLWGFCHNLAFSSPLPLGIATHQRKADLGREGGKKSLYLHSQILVCIYSSTIKNSRVSQLTFGKVHKTLLFCLLLWEACRGGNMFWQKYCLKSPNVKLYNGLCISVLLRHLWSTLRATWE